MLNLPGDNLYNAPATAQQPYFDFQLMDMVDPSQQAPAAPAQAQPYFDFNMMDMMYPKPEGAQQTPTYVPEGWNLFEGGLGQELQKYVDYSRVGLDPRSDGGADYGVYAYDPNNRTSAMKVAQGYRGGGSAQDFIPDYSGTYTDPYNYSDTQKWADNGQPGGADPWINAIGQQKIYTPGRSLLEQIFPIATMSLLTYLSGGAGAAALGPAIGATAGGAVGGGIAGGIMAAPKTIKGEGLAPLAMGVVSGALSGAAGAKGLSGVVDAGSASQGFTAAELALGTDKGLAAGSIYGAPATSGAGATNSVFSAISDTNNPNYWSNLGGQTARSVGNRAIGTAQNQLIKPILQAAFGRSTTPGTMNNNMQEGRPQPMVQEPTNMAALDPTMGSSMTPSRAGESNALRNLYRVGADTGSMSNYRMLNRLRRA